MRPKPRITRYIGLSTDAKPNADYGDTFREMDTGTVFMFDGETWHALSTEHKYSGDIVSFKARKVVPMQSVVVSMEPVQDLHGYDSPWPAGGGKNLLELSDVEQTTKNGVTYRIENRLLYINGTVTSGITLFNKSYILASDTYTFSAQILAGSMSGNNNSFNGYDSTNARKWLVPFGAAGLSDNITRTADVNSVNVAINSGAVFNNAVIGFQVERGSDMTAWSPYSNICPISGRTGAEIEHTGVNVWDEEWEVGGINSSNGANWNTIDRIRCKNYVSVKENASYYLKASTNVNIMFYDANKGYISALYFYPTDNVPFTTPQNCAYVRFALQPPYGTTYNHDISINYPATNTAYEPYQGDTLSVTFPSEAGTVYGGTPDVVSGELVVDRAMVDLGTLTWIKDSGAPSLFYSTTAPLFGTGGSALINSSETGYNNISEIYVNDVVALTNPVSGRFQVANSQAVPILRVCDDRFTNASEFAEAINGTKAVFMLYEPITYHLTPQEVRTLLGTNNVWSDAGDVTVKVKL